MKTRDPYHPTLADVARIARVGKATVSRVINGGRKVSPDTLARITKVMRELDYRPSQAARSLRGEGTKAVGLVLPRIGDSFFAACGEAAQDVARLHGYLMMLAVTNYDAQTEIQQIETLIRHRVEGILLAPANSSSKLLATLINSLNIPVTVFNDPLAGAKVPSIVCKNREGARVATEHLLKHGYRRIVCLGGDSRLYTIRERQRGYCTAMKAAGIEPLVVEETTLRSPLATTEIAPTVNVHLHAEIEGVLKRYCFPEKQIDAIFAVRNLVATCAFGSLQSMGLQIPDDVALIGFDDFELATTLRPAVTVIRQPVELMARNAANLLFEHLGQPSMDEQRRATRSSLNTALVIRNSCGCSPKPTTITRDV